MIIEEKGSTKWKTELKSVDYINNWIRNKTKFIKRFDSESRVIKTERSLKNPKSNHDLFEENKFEEGLLKSQDFQTKQIILKEVPSKII